MLIQHYHFTTSTSSTSCHFQHDQTSMVLSIIIVLGILISYLPQHYRIISSKSSHGISPWFLLLGSTSNTGSLVNAITLQWGVVRCCQVLTPGQCAESLLGIIQVLLQWACFNIILILSLIYFPSDLKYVRVLPVIEAGDQRSHSPLLDRATNYSSQFLSRFFLKHNHQSNSPSSSSSRKAKRASGGHQTRASQDSLDSSSQSSSFPSVSSDSSIFDPSNVLPPSATRYTRLTLSKEYTLSLVLALVVFIHFLFSTLVTLGLLVILPKASAGEPEGTPPSHSGDHSTVRLLRIWASASGILSLILAACQYLPQIKKTWNLRLVGSLSIPMMIIQTPGSFLFVYSLAIRPGLNWTTWIVYLVTGILQGVLLILCIFWKIKQQANGIDDWGKAIKPTTTTTTTSSSSSSASASSHHRVDGVLQPGSERTPLLSTRSSTPNPQSSSS
ncbi:hypothetical protein PSTG_13399 [Puccinia striiformis f. sp. tritici PST-78]|uniref:PQ loop repeat protein n=1 Tax=Puccinia striiformis f. sp. tritici PST-78 TaxID=1165861 RepID=A0A0L0V1S7_9BASI|nr:hypothetical protein PSTG_13399 [Puccinia striiformis f. sp. tritici PST-78]